MRRVACVGVPFAIMTVCRKLNSLQMAPPSHVDWESHLPSRSLEQSEPGSRAEIQRGGVSERRDGSEREFAVYTDLTIDMTDVSQ